MKDIKVKLHKSTKNNGILEGQKTEINKPVDSFLKDGILTLEKNFVNKFCKDLKEESSFSNKSKKKDKKFVFKVDFVIENFPKNTKKGIVRIVLSTAGKKKKIFEIEKDILEDIFKKKDEKDGIKLSLNVVIDEKAILETEENDFEMVAFFNDEFASNTLKFSKSKHDIDMFLMRKKMRSFSNNEKKKLLEQITREEEIIEQKRKEFSKYKKEEGSIKKKEFFCTLKKGRYKLVKATKDYFLFPIEIKRFKVSRECVKYSFFDKDNIKFLIKHHIIDKKDFEKGGDIVTKELKVFEEEILFAEFPIRIDMETKKYYSKSILLKRLELHRMQLMNLKKKKNMKSMLKELKECKFEIKKKEQSKKMFERKLEDLPYEMIYEILKFIPIPTISKSTILVSPFFKDVCNFFLEHRTKQFMMNKCGIGKPILLFLYKQNRSWRKVYQRLKKLSKLANSSNQAFGRFPRSDLWVGKDLYDEGLLNPNLMIGRCF